MKAPSKKAARCAATTEPTTLPVDAYKTIEQAVQSIDGVLLRLGWWEPEAAPAAASAGVQACDAATAKLAALNRLCGDIASDVLTVASILGASGTPEADIASQALRRIGWMAERAAGMAGPAPRICNGPDEWLLDSGTEELVTAASGQEGTP